MLKFLGWALAVASVISLVLNFINGFDWSLASTSLLTLICAIYVLME